MSQRGAERAPYPQLLLPGSLRALAIVLMVAVIACLGMELRAEQPLILSAAQTSSPEARVLGFDSNVYPGDAALPALRRHFSYAGFWLNTPPGASRNSWAGKREVLRSAGFGFLVLWNGRLDAQIKAQGKRSGSSPAELGRKDAAAAIAATVREHFAANTLVFLDQEEGGRLLPEQAAYLLAWTEAIARSGLRPGVYAPAQPVDEGGGHTITTAQNIIELVRAQHLQPVALWVAQDSCGPSPGCTVQPPPLAQSGTPGALVWQYAQSPRRPEFTRSCVRTYARNGDCAVPELPGIPLDLSVAGSADPSSGR